MKLLNELIDVFSKLPGVGKKSAARMAFSILEKEDYEIEKMLDTIERAHKNIKHCKICGNYTEYEICEICSDDKRNKKILTIVENVKDVIAFEKSGIYKGLYHVLGGKIDPLNGVTISDLNIDKLVERLNQEVAEVILAFNPDMEGETTSLYLSKIIKSRGIKVSKIASGIPMGGNIEFTDTVTLAKSFEYRTEVD